MTLGGARPSPTQDFLSQEFFGLCRSTVPGELAWARTSVSAPVHPACSLPSGLSAASVRPGEVDHNYWTVGGLVEGVALPGGGPRDPFQGSRAATSWFTDCVPFDIPSF